jgi:TolB protein
MKFFSILKIIAGIVIINSSLAHAQLRVEVSGVGSSQVPIAIAGFSDEAIAPQLITSIIKDDLNRSGYFKIIDTGEVISDTATIDYAQWKSKGVEALAVGSVRKVAEGRFEVRYRLYDILKAIPLSGFSADSPTPRLRLSSHKIADDIFEKLLGIPGVFSTRIAYVMKTATNFKLVVSDADGADPIDALTSHEPIISPTWSPDGISIAYVSYERKKPIVYIQNLMTGGKTIVANFKGNNSAPSWSPDGSKLLVTLSKNAIAQIYSINADGTDLQKLTSSSGIDTEARYSPDGGSVYFVSDRSGGPQIYKMNANGSDIKRLTFKGSYNISPRISPDGNTLVHVSRRDGVDQVYSIDLVSGQELKLSDTSRDESPSFAPNGRYVLYATQFGRKGSLGMVSTDGKVKQKLSIQAGDIREPTWGPFMK